MRTTKTRLLETRTESVVAETGELVGGTNVDKYIVPSEPDFVKVYTEDLMYLEQMPLGYGAILWQLIRLMKYDTNEIHLSPQLRENISLNLKCSIHSVNQAISSFMKIGLMSSKRRGTYTMNPYVFGKGDWSNVRKIRAEIEWTEEGRTIKTTLMKEDV